MPNPFERKRREKRAQENRASFNAFEDNLSAEEFDAAANKIDEQFGGALGAENAGVQFSNQKRQAQEAHQSRSQEAKASDKGQLAPLTLNADRYEENPDHLDFPGVDTPPENNLTDNIKSLGDVFR